MANFFKIKVTQNSTSPGPYTIYYDSVGVGNISLNNLDSTPATNLTLNQMLTGVMVQIPDKASKIILYNQTCATSKIFDVTPKQSTFPCICVIIFDKILQTVDKIEGCYLNNTINGKPIYEGVNGNIEWNQNGYWELINFTKPGVVFRSTDNDEIPNSLWNTFGQNAENYVVYAQTGTCASINANNSLLFAEGFDATCQNNDGSIVVTAIGGTPPWRYTIDGVYQDLGIFTNLRSGTYSVSAKDVNGNVITDSVTITTPPKNVFSVEASVIQTSVLSKVGNIQYYSVNIVYNTNEIPVNENITFDYEFRINLKYDSPGIAYFETNQNQIIKNGVTSNMVEKELQELIQATPTECNVNYFTYLGYKKYLTQNINLTRGDSFSVNVIYGIDTTTDGIVEDNCRTRAYVSLMGEFKEVKISCQCCELNLNTINRELQPQNFI